MLLKRRHKLKTLRSELAFNYHNNNSSPKKLHAKLINTLPNSTSRLSHRGRVQGSYPIFPSPKGKEKLPFILACTPLSQRMSSTFIELCIFSSYRIQGRSSLKAYYSEKVYHRRYIVCGYMQTTVGLAESRVNCRGIGR